MKKEVKPCCAVNNKKINEKSNIVGGIIYGIIPHSFCIAYIIFSILGTAFGITLFKNLFLIPYFFQILIILSLVFATISATIYLKRLNMLSVNGMKAKWKYLAVLYSTIIAVNILFFYIIFPATANLNSHSATYANTASFNEVVLQVNIPCSGHAQLIIDELKKIDGILNIKFNLPNIFTVQYNPLKTSSEKIQSIDIFETYNATIK